MDPKLKKLLIKHEGYKHKPYVDTVGKITIGVGRNLTDNGLSDDEILYLLQNDVDRTIEELSRTLSNWDQLDDCRQIALIDMVFNLGLPRFKTFKKTIKYLEEFDFENASKEMLDSKWASDVGNRAIELSEIIRTGSC